MLNKYNVDDIVCVVEKGHNNDMYNTTGKIVTVMDRFGEILYSVHFPEIGAIFTLREHTIKKIR